MSKKWTKKGLKVKYKHQREKREKAQKEKTRAKRVKKALAVLL